MTQDWFEIVIELPGGYFIGAERDTGRIFLGEQIFRRGKYTGEIIHAGIKVNRWAIRKGDMMKGVWDMKLLAEGVGLRVKLQGFSGFKLRAKIAEWIIRLGAWVAWFRVVIDDSPLPPEHVQCRTAVAEDERCVKSKTTIPPPQYGKIKPLQEDMVKKGGINTAPVTPGPDPTKGQGGKSS